MSWRDDVILAVAKRMYARVRETSGLELDWDGDSCDRAYWINAAENAIKDTRDGAQDAGWTVEFVKDLP